MKKTHILVVGGGFGGIKTALELCHHDNVAVTLMSDSPDFRYNPALYHTATGGLRAQSSIPLSEILPTDKVTLAKGTIKELDRAKKHVKTAEGHVVPYDILVLALGSVTNYFGIKGLPEYSLGIKSVDDAEEFKQHLHNQLAADHKPDLNYIIVGAGPTGIELAGALPTYLRKIMAAHGIKHRAIHIDLIEAAPRLLPRSPKSVSRAVERQLKRLGIQLYLGKTVQGETADALMVDGRPIKSHTVVWTAGMANNPFFETNKFGINPRHKVIVDEHLESGDSIYVIGDNAATPYSGMAQTALYDAVFVARDIERRINDKPRIKYQPKKPVSIIPAGPHWAAVEWGKLHFSGKKGWVLRELADYVAFHDLEPWWKATEQWVTEFGEQENCAYCHNANA